MHGWQLASIHGGRFWRASGAMLEGDVTALYGSEFADCLRANPTSAFVAQGSAIVVRRGVRL